MASMNYTVEDLNAEVTKHLYINTGILLLYLFLGTFGNTIVLYIYARKMKRSEEKYFIPALAIADIFACVAGVSLGVVSNFHRANYTLEIFCKVGYFLTWATTTVSGIIILLISLNRHLLICRSTGPQLDMTKKRRALISVVIISLVTSTPMLYFLGERHYPFVYHGQLITTTLCSLRFTDGTMHKVQLAYFAFEIFIALLNMILTFAFYIPVGVTIYQRLKGADIKAKFSKEKSEIFTVQDDSHTTDDLSKHHTEISLCEESVTLSKVLSSKDDNTSTCGQSKSYPKDNIKWDARDKSTSRKKNVKQRQARYNFTMMFATIIVFYVVSYISSLVLMIIPGSNPAEFWFSKSPVELNFLVLLQRAFLLNNIVNPFIYSYFDLTFRKEVRKIVCSFISI
ncbi:5-hydroxytryptamine receptor 1F-like [Saccostrea cucullata]|uniref:5-hydroxytryptamine receptor 1F-like n=1 Tax=Saccostrea cuccullata TaxID=36930 RepID=UPI002ED6ACC2